LFLREPFLETSMMKMNHSLSIACLVLALIASSAMPSASHPRLNLAQQKFSAADPCMTDCKMRADFCREQCAHPEEPEQCIVACSRSECNDSCNKLEDACTRHCPNPKG
jgi:hypothetical protein